MQTSIEQQIIYYLKSHNSNVQNAMGVQIGFTALNEVWTHLKLRQTWESDVGLSISTTEEPMADFIALFKIERLANIDSLGYNNLWMRYLNGQAVATVNPLWLEAEIELKIVRNKTVISCLDLHFYDEVYEHLTMSEDWERYVTEKTSWLQLAADNRYKWKHR